MTKDWEEILDAPDKGRKPFPNRRTRILHIAELCCLLILSLGVLENVEHTQFIPGVSLTYWGLLLLALLTFPIFIAYGFQFKPQSLQVPLNGLLGLAQVAWLLGLLEQLERTQFIPGVVLLYPATIASWVLFSFSSSPLASLGMKTASLFIIAYVSAY